MGVPVNLPLWERAVRVLGGIGLVVVGELLMGGPVVGHVLGVAGVIAGLTGLVGFCPACAMARRRP